VVLLDCASHPEAEMGTRVVPVIGVFEGLFEGLFEVVDRSYVRVFGRRRHSRFAFAPIPIVLDPRCR
jgi:CRISPR/Cas system-associated protein Csm6